MLQSIHTVRGRGITEETMTKKYAIIGISFLTSVAATVPASSQPYVDQFVGAWRNQNPQTDGVTRVQISNRLGQLSMHLWGRCHPTDCDNGVHPLVPANNGVVTFDFVQNTISESGTLTVLSDGGLQMRTHTHFNDASGRPDYDAVYRFVRS